MVIYWAQSFCFARRLGNWLHDNGKILNTTEVYTHFKRLGYKWSYVYFTAINNKTVKKMPDGLK